MSITNYEEQHKHEAPCKCSGNSFTRSEGELVFLVNRTSFNLVADLPYCIWGAIYLTTNNFATALQTYLPDGITASSSLEGGNLTFTYTNGSVTDQIIISTPKGALISYLESLANLNTNYMRSDFLLFNCNSGINAPTLADDQINNLKEPGLFLDLKSGGGAKQAQVIFPFSRKQINNTQKEITELYLKHEEVNAQTVWVHSFAYTSLSVPANRLRFAWTLVISERVNANAGKLKRLEAR